MRKRSDLDSTHNNTITDYIMGNLGINGDMIDLSALLSATAASTTTLVSGCYLEFTSVTDNGNGTSTVVLNVDPTGEGDHYVPLATIIMAGIQGMDRAQILQQLLNNNDSKI